MEDRTKQNEITEAKLKKAKGLLQKVLEDNGLSEILVNSEIYRKEIHNAIQEEITIGDLERESRSLKKEIKDQKIIIEEQSATIENRGFLLQQSQNQMKELKLAGVC